MIESPCFMLCAPATVMPLNHVTLPTLLINGAEDPLADTTDVNWLATQLQNVVGRTVVPNAGHGLPQLNDMSYFQQVMQVTEKFNPIY